MEKILQSIEYALQNENWYAAITVALIIPDICGKFEDSKKSSSKRYPEWFEKHLSQKYKGYLSGNDCYALRCSFLHEGSDEITHQRVREVLDYFVFTSNGAHCSRISNSIFDDLKYDKKEIITLSVMRFCEDIVEAARQRMKESPKYISEIIEIHENGFTIGGLKIQ